MKKNYILLAILALFIPAAVFAAFGDTSNYVGKQRAGDGGTRTEAFFDFPQGLHSDGKGNFYIADTFNNVIRKINSNGKVSTVVGNGSFGDLNGKGSNTRLGHPTDVATDSDGNVYIADAANGKIKKYNGSKTTTLVSDLERPEGVFVRDNKVYFTDSGAGDLYRVNRDGSNKIKITSSLNGPKKLYVRTDGEYAYVVNAGSYTIVRVKLSNGAKTVVAGMAGDQGKNNGSCSSARLNRPWGITVVEGSSLSEDDLYITDATGDPGNDENPDTYITNTADNGKIRVVDLDGSNVPETTEEGAIAVSGCEVYLFISSGDGLDIPFPRAVTRYGNHLYLLVTGISKIYKVNINDATDYTKWAGKDRFHSTSGIGGLPGRPKDLVITKNKSKIYLTENNRVRMIATGKKRVKDIVGNTVDNYQKHDEKGWKGKDGRFSDPMELDLSPNEKKLYVVDRNNHRIREIDIKNKKVYYLTGSGGVNAGGGADNGYREGKACKSQFDFNVSGCAYFSRPAGITVDKKGKYAYVADTGNQVIRRVKLKGSNKGKTKLIAGKPGSKGFSNGKRKSAKFNVPISIDIDKNSKFLYVADRNNHAIRKVRIRDGKVTTVVGSDNRAGYLDGRLEDAILNLPVEVYYNKGNIFFSESGTHRVRVVDMSDEAVKLVAGEGNRGYVNGDRDNAQFDQPVGIVRKGNRLLVSDSQNDLIRKINLTKKDAIPYTEPGPEVSSVSPASNKVAGSSSDTKALQIFGKNFEYGAVAYFGSYKANATYVNSSTEISVEIPFGLMSPGYYQVRVEGIDGQSGCTQRAYSVSDNDGNVPLTDHWASCD